jgi:predicted DNA binding CopG/RHH family protein
MKSYEWDWYWMEDEYRPGRPRTEREFKESIRKAAVAGKSWPEITRYLEWAETQRKDTRITLRISSTDVMKLKALARMKSAKMMTYTVDILKRHILTEEERLATAKIKRLARHGRSAD